MIDCTYFINDKKLYVYCEIKEYYKQIENWMSVYNTIITGEKDFYIKIYKNQTIWKINGIEKNMEGMIKHTDLYPLFYNVIANIILDDYNILLHSAVLCYNNTGILVIGDFNSGKTTLCLNALKNNINVVSADQTHLYYKNDKIILLQGSSYMKINDDNKTMLYFDKMGIEIKFIINIVGICDDGRLKFELVDNNEHKIKILFKSCTWHADIPLFTNRMMLDIDRIKIYNWLYKIDLPFYSVRGDSNKVIKKLKEIIK